MTPRRTEYLLETGRHEQAKAELQRTSSPLRKYSPRIQRIFDECAAQNDISVAEMIRGPQTARATNAKRQTVHRLAELGFTLSEMGRFLNRHHTSIHYLLQQRPKGSSDRKPMGWDYGPIEYHVPDLSGEWAI